MQTNVDKPKQTRRRKRKQTRASADKRKQMLTPPLLQFLTPPLLQFLTPPLLQFLTPPLLQFLTPPFANESRLAEEEIHPKRSTPQKSSSEEMFLNNFCWVPDSCDREEGKSSRELFEKVRVNAVFFWYFGILGGFLGL